MKIFNSKIQLLALAVFMAAIFTLSSCEKEQLLNDIDTNTQLSEELTDSHDGSNQRACYVYINNGFYQYLPNNSAVSSSFGVCNTNVSGSVTTNNSWITLYTTTFSSGSSVHYSVSQNNGSGRYGFIKVGCRYVTIHQKGVGSTPPNPPNYNPTCPN